MLMMTACAGSDEESGQVTAEPDMEIRPGTEVPDFPSENPNNGENNDENPQNNANNNTPTPDMGSADAGSCPQGSCIVGATGCDGEDLQTCVDDPVNPGCGTWQTSECFSAQEVCVQGACQVPMGCIDNDGDGYGINCTAGPDCDDGDADKFPGNPELCDSKDNDCNGAEDDGLGIGQSCTRGMGTCTSMGVTACDTDGTTYCDAAQPTGSAEVCDGMDNDCDGVVDNGMVCQMCATDINEPNDTLMTGVPLGVSDRQYGYTCPMDAEFFTLPQLQNNREYRLMLAAPQFLSDLELVLYRNGTAWQTVSSPGIDYEGVQWFASASDTYAVEVKNPGAAENLFSVGLVRTSSICPAEDAFAPNHTMADAAVLLRDWTIDGTYCQGTPDYYQLGEAPAGSTITVTMTDEFAATGDLDLFLFHDPDGNGSYTLAKRETSSSNSDEVLTYTVGATSDFIVVVDLWSGAGDRYTLNWTY